MNPQQYTANKKKKVEEEEDDDAKKVPADFHQRLATKIITINERELDENNASSRVASLVLRNCAEKDMYFHFLEAMNFLIESEDSSRYAATTWASLVINEDEDPKHTGFVDKIIQYIIESHQGGKEEPYQDDYENRKFSAYSHSVGEVFINMMRVNSDLYEIITRLYGQIIRYEMEEDLKQGRTSAEEETLKKISLAVKKRRGDEEDVPQNTKKLYDDIIDYISYRSEYKSESLNQKNPNEFIIVLADRMRSTRRYIIQDIMNRHALEKRKQIEKELSEREASAEDMILAGAPFRNGLYLFWAEKRYNFKYLAVEKVRVTLEIFSILLGLGATLSGYIGKSAIGLWQGVIIALFMFVFAKVICSRKFFKPYFPKDMATELENEVGAFTPTLRKMSFPQLNFFLTRQIKDPKNEQVIQVIPEYLRYVFSVIPDRQDLLIGTDELGDVIEQAEVNLSKYQRGKL
ncbi:MAG: hypothetical protein ACI86H_001339 [bacterium]